MLTRILLTFFLAIPVLGAPQENDNNIEVVEAGAGPSQQAWPQPRGYGGPQTRPWGGPQSWTRPAPQWSGPMGYSAPNWARPAPQYQAYPQPQWSAPQPMMQSYQAPSDQAAPGTEIGESGMPKVQRAMMPPDFSAPASSGSVSAPQVSSMCNSRLSRPLSRMLGGCGSSGYNGGNMYNYMPTYPVNSGYNPGFNSGYNPGYPVSAPIQSDESQSGFNPGTEENNNSGFNPGTVSEVTDVSQGGNSGFNPGYSNSFTQIPGPSSCYSVCAPRPRPGCSAPLRRPQYPQYPQPQPQPQYPQYPQPQPQPQYPGGGCRPMSRPVCKTRCNVTPVCGGQWQSQGQGSFSCGQGSSGYNPGYGYNPAISIPAQNGYMGVNTLPAGNTGGCSMGGGCSDGGSGSSGMRPVQDVAAGNQPIIFDDSDSTGEGEEVIGGEGGDGSSGFNPGDY